MHGGKSLQQRALKCIKQLVPHPLFVFIHFSSLDPFLFATLFIALSFFFLVLPLVLLLFYLYGFEMANWDFFWMI